MIGLFLIGIGIWVWVEMRERQLTWREIKGVTRFLLTSKGMEPDPVCRACGVPLPDPIFRMEIGHGAIVCEKCEDEINAEVGLAYPSWFERPLPPEEAARPAIRPPSTYVCAGCGEEHPEDHICMVDLKKYVQEDEGPGFKDDWFRDAQLACPNPNMNTVVIKPFPNLSPRNKETVVRSVYYCEKCKVDHRGHETCTYVPAVCAWCQREIADTARAKGTLCFHCIMWGRPPHPFDHVSDEDLIAMFRQHKP